MSERILCCVCQRPNISAAYIQHFTPKWSFTYCEECYQKNKLRIEREYKHAVAQHELFQRVTKIDKSNEET